MISKVVVLEIRYGSRQIILIDDYGFRWFKLKIVGIGMVIFNEVVIYVVQRINLV